MTTSNGQYYFSISASPVVRKRLNDLMDEADRNKYGTRFRHIVRAIYDLLRVHARKAGEHITDYPALDMQLRRVIIQSVLVEFGVHRTKPLVFIRDVKIIGSV